MTGQYGWGLPVAASTFAKDIDRGLLIIHVAMFAIFILWAVFFTYLLIRYRRREGVAARTGHGKLIWSLLPDAAVLVFELTLIFLYAVPQWRRIKMSAPPESASNRVEVVAEQFGWTAHYAGPDGKFGRKASEFIELANTLGLDPEDEAGKDDIVSVNHLHLPLGRPTVITLTSKDVIHSFFIPEFRVKQDAVPGMRFTVWFEPTMTGRFELSCAQLCGVGHANMRADVTVHSPEEFEAWLKSRAPQSPA